MKKLITLCLIFFISYPTYCFGAIRREQVELLVNFLNSFVYRPNHVVSYLCEKNDGVLFTKIMADNNYYVSNFVNETAMVEFLPSQNLVYVVDYSCNSGFEILTVANSSKKFQSPYKWFIFSNISANNPLLQQSILTPLSNLSILSDSNFNVITYLRNSTFSVAKIYKFRLHSPFIVENHNWNMQTINKYKQFNNASLRKNLMKTIIKSCLVITNNDSLNHLTDRRDAHIDTLAKVNYVLVRHLADILNATLAFTIETSWGYKDNNSKWSGMIGALTRHEGDLGGTPLFVTQDRVKIIEYVAMTTPTGSKFVFLEPKLSYVENIFSLPFHYTIWISIFCMLIFCGIPLLGVILWEKKNLGLQVTHSGLEVCFLELSAFCQQGISLIPRSLTGKMITLMLLIVLMFLYNSYSANIVALLQSSSNSIQTINDLLHSRLSVGVDDTVYNRFYFPNETEPIRRALYFKKVAPPGQPPRYFPMAEGVRRIREGLFAFHMETGAGYRLIAEIFQEHEKCGLQEIEFLQIRNPWLAVQKNSSFKEAIKIGLKTLAESGIQKREVSLLYTKKPPCISRGSGFISVGIVDTYFAFAVLVSGIFGSIALCLIEVTIHYIHLKPTKQQFGMFTKKPVE